jgi:hypothetical protein
MKGRRGRFAHSPRHALGYGLLLSLVISSVIYRIYVMPQQADIAVQHEALMAVTQPAAQPSAAPDFLLAPTAVAEWISELVLLLHQHGLEVVSLQPQTPEVDLTWARQTVAVTLFGTYAHIEAWLAHWAAHHPHARLQSFQAEALPNGLMLVLQIELWLHLEGVP